MTPSQIIITVCLAVAPLLLGAIIGRTLASLYEAKNNWIGTWEWSIGHYLYLEDWQVRGRQEIIVSFWLGLGGLVGGCLSGTFAQACTGWWFLYV